MFTKNSEKRTSLYSEWAWSVNYILEQLIMYQLFCFQHHAQIAESLTTSALCAKHTLKSMAETS